MIDPILLLKSQKMFEVTKEYYFAQNLQDCVIEISDKPMSEWVIHFTPAERQMSQKQCQFISNRKPFITIYSEDDESYFYFSDCVIKTLVLATSDKLIYSNIDDYEKVDIEDVKKEFAQLKEILQGS